MNVLILDENLPDEGSSLAFALRCLQDSHHVRVWSPKKCLVGDRMIEKVEDWKPWMGWADLIVPTGNTLPGKQLDPYIEAGYAIFAPSSKGAELELNRGKAFEVLEAHDVPVPEYEIFSDIPAAIAYVRREKKAFACKPYGNQDRHLSFVADSPEDLIFYLEKAQSEGAKGRFVLQKKITGVEMSVSGFFSKYGWSGMIEECWEEKKFLTGSLGENTGEMGTTIRYAAHSALFDRVLAPLTPYLEEIAYTGDINVNCVIDENGIPWPLELTCRLGWPDWSIRLMLHTGDMAQQMLDCINKKDSWECISEIAVGVCMIHGDFPHHCADPKENCGYPLRGVNESNLHQLALQCCMWGNAPAWVGSKITDAPGFLTAGNYVLVARGAGLSVQSAIAHAYDAVEAISWPSNVGYRLDIGKRLERELPILHGLGYAMGAHW